MLFDGGSEQDPEDSDKVIAGLDQGGLGLPDRDYYTKDDAKSKETRGRYVQHVQHVFELSGDDPATAKTDADTSCVWKPNWLRLLRLGLRAAIPTTSNTK
jgi:putative endopeptidase